MAGRTGKLWLTERLIMAPRTGERRAYGVGLGQEIEVPTVNAARVPSSRGILAISMRRVGKRYKLYPSIGSRIVDIWGLRRLLRWREAIPEIAALHDVNIDVRQGERIAIIGRNGAGKSTLMKLICGNISPSSGILEVHGRISALLDLGLGFHEEFSGLANIRASLAYNGLSAGEFEGTVAGVVEFCELGAFLHLPVKTYSAGMKSRIYFAVATAVKPDIVIIDEMLATGDAYFEARSADRMAQLISRGSAVVLVTHNLDQALHLCDRAIWIEGGRIQRDGPAAEIVEAYRQFSAALQQRYLEAKYGAQGPESADRWIRRRLAKNMAADLAPLDPNLMPVAVEARLWTPDRQPVNQLECARELDVSMSIRLRPGEAALRVRPVVYLFAADGRMVARSVGPVLNLRDNAPLTSVMRYAPLLTGPGEFLVTGVLVDADHRAEIFRGMFARSLRFEVVHPDPTEASLVLQPADWTAVALPFAPRN
jgi:lipopolysaccharide transport system ATP-binding protein